MSPMNSSRSEICLMDHEEAAPRFSVVVPCYNEEHAVLDTVAALRGALADAGPYELIFVNDGSTDRTGEMLAQAARQDPQLRVLTHPQNRGYGASLKTGILHATAEYIAIADADGTYPIDQIPALLERGRDVDMVVGARTAPNVQYPWLRRFAKMFLRSYASWIVRTSIPDINSGLRVFRRDVAIRFFYIISDGFSFTTTITLAMLTNGFAVRYVPIGYQRRVGKSKIKPIRDTLNFFHLIARVGLCFAPMRTLQPLIAASAASFTASLAYDVFVLNDLTDKTVLFLVGGIGVVLCADGRRNPIDRAKDRLRATVVPRRPPSFGSPSGKRPGNRQHSCPGVRRGPLGACRRLIRPGTRKASGPAY